MKKVWPTKLLQSLCDDFMQDIVDGPFGSDLQRKDYITKGVPVLKIQNVKPFVIELKKMDYVSSEKFKELKRHSYRSGDIVLTKLGNPLGASAIVEELGEGVIVADLVRIRAQHVDTKYLCYHLNSSKTNDLINSMQKGTTRPRVTLSVVRELPILVPPPNEQQRIVSILDKAFDGIAIAKANAEKNLQNARELFESYLQSVFSNPGESWEEKRLGDVCEVIAGQSPEGKYYNSTGEGLPFYQGKKEFTEKLLGEPKTWTTSVTKESQKDDILMSVRAPVGPINLSTRRICIGRGLAAIRASSVIDKEFLFYFLLNFESEIIGNAGAVFDSISKTQIENIPLPLPSLPEQLAIVAKLEELTQETQRLETIYQQKLAALEELKKSLLQQAFNGEL